MSGPGLVKRALEWAAYSFAILTAGVYGYSKGAGGVLGLCTSCLFICYGLYCGVKAASYTNGLFIPLHANNLWIALHE